MIPLAKAQKFAAAVVDQLRPHCRRIEIAGSIRRERPEVGDIDLVIEAADRRQIDALIQARCSVQKNGEQYLSAIHRASGYQVEIWFTRIAPQRRELGFFDEVPAQHDNFGSVLLCRTGSKEHNIALAARARRLGMHWNPHQGLYQEGVLVASASEAEIYRALGLDFIEPAAREIASHADQQRLVYAGKAS